MPITLGEINGTVLNPVVVTTPEGSHVDRIEQMLIDLNKGLSRKPTPFGFSFDLEQPAIMTVVPDGRAGSTTTDPINSTATRDFMLTSVEEQRAEKFQLIETFGDPALLFFDKKSNFYSFSGYFLDAAYKVAGKEPEINERTSDAVQFKYFWENTFRGTKLVQEKKIAVVTFNGNGIWGYPIRFSTNVVVGAPFLSGFSFSMLVVKHKYVDSPTVSILSKATPDQQASYKTLMDILTAAEKTYKEAQSAELLNATADQKALTDATKAVEKAYDDLVILLNSIAR